MFQKNVKSFRCFSMFGVLFKIVLLLKDFMMFKGDEVIIQFSRGINLNNLMASALWFCDVVCEILLVLLVLIVI